MAGLVRSFILRYGSSVGAAASQRYGLACSRPSAGGVAQSREDFRRWMTTKDDDKKGHRKTKEESDELKPRPKEHRKQVGSFEGKPVYEIPLPRAVGPENEIADSRDMATGMERLEIEIGTDRITEGPEGLIAEFGTAENPAQIESAFDERIVGCTGRRYPDDHEVLWMWVRKGETSVCPFCEQHFVLKPLTFDHHEKIPEPEQKI